MISEDNARLRSDAPLWAAALVMSFLLNVLVIAAMSHEAVRKVIFSRDALEAHIEPVPERVLQMVFTPPEVAAEVEPEPAQPRFARTSEDQRAERPENTAFIGERDTRATSDRAPDADAPALPSQAGIEPRNETEFETTESDFRDGPLDAPDSNPSPAATATAAPPRGVDTAQPGEADTPNIAEPTAPPTRERLLEGPHPTDVPALAEIAEPEEVPPAPEPPAEPPKQGVAEAPPPTPEIAADPTLSSPGFRGQQRKTTIRGSISRTGRSSLDVEDSALGRYQASISRAVELEWQRNCVRHRDFITPGFLTVRFFVEPGGRVRSVEFVGEMETGEVQKGFTLNSIRNAPIPPMPRELRKELRDEPLELIFNFYF